MKRIFTNAICICAVAIASISCDNAKYSVITNAVYIDEAAPADKFTQQIETVVLNGVYERALNIRLMNYADQDVTVNLDIDGEFISEYNSRKGSSYEVLPEEYRSFDRTVRIPAGSLSEKLNLRIEPFEAKDGKAYALPIKIASVEGPVEAVSSAGHIMLLFANPVTQKTPVLTNANGSSGAAFTTPFQSLDELTMEFWMKMDNIYGGEAFYGNSSPISTGEFYIRWWAKNYTTGDGPWFQNQMSGAYMDDLSHPWVAGKWYHIAYTFDGNDLTLFINGEEDVSMTLAGKKFSFGSLTFAQNLISGQTASLAQLRLWGKCLGQSTIRENMSREVAPDSNGLLGYWKMDEGEGSEFKDATGNGNDIPIKGTLQWSDPVNFLNPNSSTSSDD
ncbi:MAG: DUF1735 and LamG domain-containing protein [Candidatus Cryptobacteroides sp.]